jgi:CheY-like chemotaxis protein
MSEVLIVEDDPITCELIQEVFTSAEIKAEAVTDSSEAAKQLKKKKFDAAFLDVRMPAPDGIELARQMRASGLNQKTLIVIITGDDDPQVLTRAFQAGVNFVLFKPVFRQALLRLIRVTQGPIEHERQRFTRINICLKASLQLGQDELAGTTVDLSLNGMLLRASRVMPLGAFVKVTVELESGNPAIHCAARVVRLVGDDCMGLQFDNVGLADNQRLQAFLVPLIAAAG